MKTPRTSLSLAFSVSALAGLDGFGFRLFLPVVVSRLVARKRSYRAWASGSPAVALSSLASSSNDRLRASPVEWPFSCRAASSDRPDCVPTAVLPPPVPLGSTGPAAYLWRWPQRAFVKGKFSQTDFTCVGGLILTQVKSA